MMPRACECPRSQSVSQQYFGSTVWLDGLAYVRMSQMLQSIRAKERRSEPSHRIRHHHHRIERSEEAR